MTLTLRYAARSDRGLIRDGNEDSVYAGPRLLAVADGMGGHAAGEVASQITIHTLATLDEDAPGGDLLDALRGATLTANQHLRDMVAGDPGLDGMGTTLTALLSAGSRLGLVHVGDSRAYLFREGQLALITRDHTLVQSLVDEGRITADEAHTHPQRSLITRALDGREDVELDLSVREARLGDRYLLCTDGLSGVVSEETMAEALRIGDPQAAADRLVELALRGGGPDNVTCIVADVVDSSLPGTATGDDPVVAGAAAGGTDGDRPPPADSAAGRAARAAPAPPRREPAAAAEPTEAPHGRRWRAPAIALAVLVVLAAVAGASWAYVRAQFYVGADGDRVAVYRGVNGSVLGMDLSHVTDRTDVKVDDLQPVARRQVQDGIAADSASAAERIVVRLRGQMLPPCPAGRPAATPAVPATPSRGTAGATSPPPAATPPAGPTPAGRTPAATPTPAPTPVPGTDCRPAS